MRFDYFSGNPLKYILGSQLFESKGRPAAVFFISAVSLFTGFFCCFCLTAADLNFLSEPIEELFSGKTHPFYISFISNVLFLTAILLLGLTIYGFVFALILLTGKSFSIGFCTGLLLWGPDDSTRSIVLFSAIPVNVLVLLTFITGASAAVSYAVISMHNPSARITLKQELLFTFLILAAALLIISIFESLSIHILQH